MWVQTFTESTRRYKELVCDLPTAARDLFAALESTDFGLERAALVRFARGYFNLCSEEHFLHARNRIDHIAWEIWCCGISDMQRLPWIRELWVQLRHEYDGYPEFVEFFEVGIADAVAASAKSSVPLHRPAPA